jgi:hypothetical protein
MTSEHDLPAEFAQACERGDYLVAIGLAAELKPLSLAQGLDLLPLIAEHEPAKFDAAARGWHARWEREATRVDSPRSRLALTALGALRGPQRADGLRVLRALV